MKPGYVRGVGLWTPGFANPHAWCGGKADDAETRPAAALLAGNLRRRATGLTRIAVEAMHQATVAAGCDPATIPSVWATVHGEHETGVHILGMMHRGEGKVSPTKFHNSVFNTASGYASIATGNGAASTTLTGGREIVATSLLESLCWLDSGVEDVVVVLADEPLATPFDRSGSQAALAVALCLSTRPDGALAVLSDLRRDAVATLEPHERFGSLYVAAVLPLLESIVHGRPGTVALEVAGSGGGDVACVDVARVAA